MLPSSKRRGEFGADHFAVNRALKELERAGVVSVVRAQGWLVLVQMLPLPAANAGPGASSE